MTNITLLDLLHVAPEQQVDICSNETGELLYTGVFWQAPSKLANCSIVKLDAYVVERIPMLYIYILFSED